MDLDYWNNADQLHDHEIEVDAELIKWVEDNTEE